ncbi:DUF4817 domain-containing protein, partial [Nephila pilipes]
WCWFNGHFVRKIEHKYQLIRHLWCKKVKARGCFRDKQRSGRPGPSAQAVTDERETHLRSSTKSIICASRESGISQSTVWRIVHKNLCIKPCRLQLLQALTSSKCISRTKFCFSVSKNVKHLMPKLIFRDESTFHMSRKVNRHNSHAFVCGTENSHRVVATFPEVNSFCAILPSRVYGPFFLHRRSLPA